MNLRKNRYENIHPCEKQNSNAHQLINFLIVDETRVKLTPLEDVEGSDYINASYVDVGCYCIIILNKSHYVNTLGI